MRGLAAAVDEAEVELEPEVPQVALAVRGAVHVGPDLEPEAYEEVHEVQQHAQVDRPQLVAKPANGGDTAAPDREREGRGVDEDKLMEP